MANQIEQLVIKLSETLRARHFKLVTAESCTGGGLTFEITRLAGSSHWFERGFVTYSNLAKIECLGVSEKILRDFGSVSAETARAMAAGALKHSAGNLSVAITGIAGPDGGSSEKPVGLVWIAVAGIDRETKAKKFLFSGDRQMIRESSIKEALSLLLEM
ncbi:MAG TPA: CinA family protein [Gammaproteobacteria bacterium]|nr:CinA family protein [Gammaproteobacteria bacterium]